VLVRLLRIIGWETFTFAAVDINPAPDRLSGEINQIYDFPGHIDDLPDQKRLIADVASNAVFRLLNQSTY
jgi:hypothetical protein